MSGCMDCILRFRSGQQMQHFLPFIHLYPSPTSSHSPRQMIGCHSGNQQNWQKVNETNSNERRNEAKQQKEMLLAGVLILFLFSSSNKRESNRIRPVWSRNSQIRTKSKRKGENRNACTLWRVERERVFWQRGAFTNESSHTFPFDSFHYEIRLSSLSVILFLRFFPLSLNFIITHRALLDHSAP